jgi:hypothetical protein
MGLPAAVADADGNEDGDAGAVSDRQLRGHGHLVSGDAQRLYDYL